MKNKAANNSTEPHHRRLSSAAVGNRLLSFISGLKSFSSVGVKPIPDLVPAVSLRYWKEDSSQGPGSGNNIGNISEKK
jgi:hypothetical protein